jgi:hypothetical protein
MMGNGTFQTRHFLQRHNHPDGKWYVSDAPLFTAPQTRSDIRAPIRGATQERALVFKVSSSFEMAYEITKSL